MTEYIKIVYEALDLQEAITKQDYYSDVFDKNDSKYRTQILMHEDIFLVEFVLLRKNVNDKGSN